MFVIPIRISSLLKKEEKRKREESGDTLKAHSAGAYNRLVGYRSTSAQPTID
jgi:hypothetical protein